MTHSGTCFCGAVEIEVRGQAEGMAYCHCASCRSWSAAPISTMTFWKRDAVRVVRGAEHLSTFAKTQVSERQFCSRCGGHLMANLPAAGMVDVFAATLPTLRFEPELHVNYQETVLPIRDGLPKMKDLPADFGGSGEIIAE
jgi:hypothetical protein